MTNPQSSSEAQDEFDQNLTEAESQQNAHIQSFSELNIMNNGNMYHNINDLPPEARQKVQAAMDKLRANPKLFNMITSFANSAKTANQFGAVPINGQNKEALKAMLKSMVNNVEGQIENQTNNPAGWNSGTPDPSVSAQSPQQVASMGARNYAQLNQQRSTNPTFNPHVQGDSLRRNIFIIAAVIIIGYLVIKFGFNGQLPF